MPGRYNYEWDADVPTGGHTRVSRLISLWEDRAVYGDDDDDDEDPDSKPPQPDKPTQPRAPKADKEELNKIVSVSSIDFHISENTEKHRTKLYDRTRESKTASGKVVPGALVVRRGDDIKLTLRLSREYDEKNDDLWFGLTNGDDPMAHKGTLVELPMAEKEGDSQRGPKGWSAKLISKTKDSITITIRIPANAVVGEWKVFVRTVTKGTDKDGNEKTKSFEFRKNALYYIVTILFNPWCKEDVVYMPETKLLDEYVLNDSTSVYQGSAKYNRAKAWAVGQFETACLDASLKILNRASAKIRSDPVHSSRHIVKLVNSNDDDGVLIGNWSGKYDDGTRPTHWSGSRAILTEYLTKGKPVRYGQCWVFAMLTNTVCRALGIPCRGITNFASAHDTDLSITIDKIYFREDDGTPEGALEEREYGDSIWNFHVWNEVWMRRPDLDARPDVKTGQYDGWQVIDATPQEESGGVYTCGPSPKTAIKNGECWIPYDTPFVFSEVNADVVHWELTDAYELWRFKLEPHAVGRNISTKYPDCKGYAVWREKRLLVTDEYKYGEGTPAEEEAVKRAYEAAGEHKHEGAYKKAEDNRHQLVKLEVLLPEKVIIGHDLDIGLVLNNTGKHPRTVRKAEVRLKPQIYTGYSGPTFFKKNLVALKPITLTEKETLRVKVTADEYYIHLIDEAIVLVEAQLEVDRVDRAEQEQTTLEQEIFQFAKPPLTVKCDEKCEISTPVQFTLTFTNPINFPLTNCVLSTESSVGFENIDEIKQSDVPALGDFKTTVKLMPKTVGANSVVFVFECTEIYEIEGTADVEIYDRNAATSVVPPVGN